MPPRSKRASAFFLLSFFFGFVTLTIGPLSSYAQDQSSSDTATSTLQKQVDDTSAKILELQKEITQLQGQLNTTSAQKKTLQSAIAGLNLNILKLQKSIALAKAQIVQKNSQIGTLSITIATTTNNIALTQKETADTLRGLDRVDQESLLGVLLAGGTLSSFFDEATTLTSLRSSLEDKIRHLSSLKTTLQSNKVTAELKRNELNSLQQGLSEKQQGLAVARDTQNELLAETKNKESAYQALLAQKKAQEAQFEQDLEDFQAKLHLTVTAGSLPPTGSSPLAWPTDAVRITQYFGNTPFATQNPQIYNGHGHSGVDLAASPGTPIKAARAGVVLGTGNTDATCPGASFGRWVFIKHDDGLSTLYAHLATIAVSKGQSVTGGQLVGFSDTSGYATGPHLHFGVYASSGSEIASFPSSSCRGKTYTMPVGDLSAYLNPLSYLPPVP